jgi:hypothetical protein
LTVDFFSEANGGGTRVGTAVGNGNVAATGQDGTVPTFALTESAISTLTVVPATLPLGATTQLLFSARDSQGVNLALTPGSGIFSLANPADSARVTLTPDGLATPTETAPAALGSVGVIVRIDGKASPTLSIPLVSNGTLTLTPTTADNRLISYEQSLQFNATVTGLPAGASTAVTYRVGNAAGDPDNSGNSGTVSNTGLYTAPRLTGTYSVTAISTYDPSKRQTTLVRVESLVAVAITPTNSNDPTSLDVVVNNTVPLVATLSNIPAGRDAGVTWSIVDAAGGPVSGGISGSITPEGVYTAPATRGTYYVQAVSRYDTNKKFTIRINALAGTIPVTVE